MRKKVVKKLVPKTTNNITKGIIDFLLIRGHSAARINTQGQAYEDPTSDELGNISNKIQWRRSGSTLGVYDIIACLKLHSGRAGAFHAVEVKRVYKNGKDKERTSQVQYAKTVSDAGGILFSAIDLEHYKEYYYSFLEPEIIDKL